MKLADTRACRLAGDDWIQGQGIRGALELGLPGGFTLEDVGEFAKAGYDALLALAPTTQNVEAFEGRFVGAIAAALILGAKLQETGGR